MSHKIYTTEAIVVGSRANNTSDKSFLLFTDDAGMLWATARSVREERSRQRYALQDFALIRVSLIQGKSGWRIGSVEGEKNYFREASGDARFARAAITSIIRLLRQFVHGEIPQSLLFTDLKKVLEKAVKIEDQEESKHLLDIFTLRLLHTLGYIVATPEAKPYLTEAGWWELPSLSIKLKKAVEQAKQASHL